jgi:hypothetical protein
VTNSESSSDMARSLARERPGAFVAHATVSMALLGRDPSRGDARLHDRRRLALHRGGVVGGATSRSVASMSSARRIPAMRPSRWSGLPPVVAPPDARSSTHG